MKYPKIQTLWKRHDSGLLRGTVIYGDYSEEEFGIIKKWEVQEKIDGTNIRIRFSKGKKCNDECTPQVEFLGRGDDAQIPMHLLKYLKEHFTIERLSKVFDTCEEVYLFGEGYGPKIQGPGGNYRADAGFIAFDIKVGNWWLKQEDIAKIAQSLDIPSAPIIGTMTEQEIIEYVKSKPLSLCSRVLQMMEGVICRTQPLLLLRNGERLMFKLKVKDFING